MGQNVDGVWLMGKMEGIYILYGGWNYPVKFERVI
jgi:hypothetical protein